MEYLNNLESRGFIKTKEGKNVELFELCDVEDDDILNEWAAHLRNHYCLDEMLDRLRKGTELNRHDYLMSLKFPDHKDSFGPATRSGDFTEILIADYLEYILDYYVPRERYLVKFNKNSSPQGSDVIGFKMLSHEDSIHDELVVFEVKAQAGYRKQIKNRLQDAINDSAKDAIRKGETLNALKQRMIEKGDEEQANLIERFQNKADRPYIEKFGAAAVHDATTFSEKVIESADTKGRKIWMIAIKKEKLMDFIHELYERAATC